ncbi:hypothetical protein B0T24DRAFT_681019 [Lasiosphaeria ovina]|uniref:Uncharacterized protein n=1 Tax=Lasiosphaeria ovina TaxID=92902 RepID=A0AAE0N3M9_9PEZI|nr:hypothetical protein B0T24DRAFT_681019 [Lasiosphaeria ovina]
MSQQPPPHRKSSKRKRKRALSTTSVATATTGPNAVINPLSHRPSTLKQFAVAGLAPDSPLPSQLFPGFPHRPLPRDENDDDDDDDQDAAVKSKLGSDGPGSDDEDVENDTPPIHQQQQQQQQHTTDAETDNDTDQRRSRSRSRGSDGDGGHRKAQAYLKRVAWLKEAVARCLGEDDISGARRAFGLLARARVYGPRVDLRYDGYWRLGGEVLRREAEQVASASAADDDDEDGEEREARLRACLARQQAYYGALIQQYPYSRLHPRSVSALHFYAPLFECELRSVWAEYRRGAQRLMLQGTYDSDGSEDDDDDAMDVDRHYSQPQTQTQTQTQMQFQYHPAYEFYGDGEDGIPPPSHQPRSSPHQHNNNKNNNNNNKQRRQQERLRLGALERMRDLARRMDERMWAAPYATEHGLMRVRAAVAVHTGALSVPAGPVSGDDDGGEGRRACGRERAKARQLLLQIREDCGGKLELREDREMLAELGSDEEEDEDEDEKDMDVPA